MIDFEQELHKLRECDALRSFPLPAEAHMVNLSTNDYMGIADRTDLRDQFLASCPDAYCHFTAASSRLLTGNHLAYTALENELTDLYGGRSATVFDSGYHVNTGLLPCLADKNDLILIDKLAHASLVDATVTCRANGVTVMRFNHNDVAHLTTLLQKYRSSAQRCFIVTESIFSMDGDMAPLAEFVEVKKRFDSWLYVDEAHGVGVRGPQGEGLLGELGLVDQTDIIVGTCGKALASVGAYAITDPTVAQWIVNKCRTMIFTTALPPINVAWTTFVVRQLRGMNHERQELINTSLWLHEQLGLCANGGITQIIPYICGENSSAVANAARLRNGGFYVLPIRHPTVPLHQARLRLSLKANISKQQLMPLVALLSQHS